MSLLELKNVTKVFGGLRAVANVSFKVEPSQIVGLIGPNGAGKTTLFNLITGFLTPNEGDIVFQGRSLLGLRPHDVCNAGITRTFQLVKPFPGLTVIENVMVGAFHNTRKTALAIEEGLRVLEFLNLTPLTEKRADSLTLSQRRHLELARAIATKPKLLLLDEPVGGLNLTEVEEMMLQIKKIRDSGIAIVIIEHVMKAVMSISDRIAVLHHGQKIAEDSPTEISMNRDVITAYLGETSLVS